MFIQDASVRQEFTCNVCQYMMDSDGIWDYFHHFQWLWQTDTPKCNFHVKLHLREATHFITPVKEQVPDNNTLFEITQRWLSSPELFSFFQKNILNITILLLFPGYSLCQLICQKDASMTLHIFRLHIFYIPSPLLTCGRWYLHLAGSCVTNTMKQPQR